MADPQKPSERPSFAPDLTERPPAPGFTVEQPQAEQPATAVPEQEPRREQRESEPQGEQQPTREQGKPSLKKFLPKKKKVQHIIPQARDELTREVESIMEDGLADAFKELSPLKQQEFKILGEKTAIEIRNMLRGAHVRVKSIFKLLLEWLKLLPGINRFFLEQEAKIKAERILSLRKKTGK